MKVGDIVVNVDGYIAKIIRKTENIVTIQYKKVKRIRQETWDIDFVRLADESEIMEYKDTNCVEDENE